MQPLKFVVIQTINYYRYIEKTICVLLNSLKSNLKQENSWCKLFDSLE